MKKAHTKTLLAGVALLEEISSLPAETIVIAPEQQTIIREYVKKSRWLQSTSPASS